MKWKKRNGKVIGCNSKFKMGELGFSLLVERVVNRT